MGTLQKTNANPVQTFYNDDEVTSDWVDENNGLSNEEEDEISSNKDNALKLYLDEVENDDGSHDGNGQKRSDRSKRFTVEFNGMQGRKMNFIFRYIFCNSRNRGYCKI